MISFSTFSSSLQKTVYPLAVILIPDSLPQPQAITSLLSVALPLLDILYHSNTMWPLVNGFFHLVFQASSMLQHVPIFHSFLLPKNIPLSEYTMIDLFISRADGHLVFSVFEL